ncbi:MAG: calcium-binding protein [Lyngbya sp.]|nr:calcium-binding protein [Lyngbya sp.]
MSDIDLQLLGLTGQEVERVESFGSFVENQEDSSSEVETAPSNIMVDAVISDEFTPGTPDEFDLASGSTAFQILGTSGNDDIVGTEFADFIDALAGRDRVSGRLGNDTIEGGIGSDDLAGQGGNDEIFGEDGSDLIYGDSRPSDNPLETFFGSDKISGGDGRDIIFGGLGDDSISGDRGADALSGGDGNDDLNGGAGQDNMIGGEGNDDLNGDGGNDIIFGEDGDDLVDGGGGADLLYGDRRDSSSNAIGNDTIIGGGGTDTLIGGARNDSLDGGRQNDRLIGVEDFQTEFDFGADTIDTLTGGAGSDTFVLGGIGENSQEFVYYNDGNPQQAGLDDYALITDFTLGTDLLEVVGSASDYVLSSSPAGLPSGLGVFSVQAGEPNELIAILEGVSFIQSSSPTTNSSSSVSLDSTNMFSFIAA